MVVFISIVFFWLFTHKQFFICINIAHHWQYFFSIGFAMFTSRHPRREEPNESVQYCTSTLRSNKFLAGTMLTQHWNIIITVNDCLEYFDFSWNTLQLIYNIKRPNRITQCCTQFKSTENKILCLLYYHINEALIWTLCKYNR